jgi:hypothetical protein
VTRPPGYEEIAATTTAARSRTMSAGLHTIEEEPTAISRAETPDGNTPLRTRPDTPPPGP